MLIVLLTFAPVWLIAWTLAGYFMAHLRGSGGGLRIAGMIFGFGLGPLPITIIGLVLRVKRRKRTFAPR